ncbi:MAG: diguanylate cyclase [Pseudomonadales bacterium]|nr:diguanylate cyclase [Pseudomonadales bacterium]
MPASTLIFAPSLAGTVLSIAVAVIAGTRRSGPAWPWMVLLGVAVAWWCFGQTFWILADTPAEALRVNQVQYVGVQFAPLLWLLVALAQTGHRRWLRPWRVAPLLVVPLLTLAFAWTCRLEAPNWLWSGFHVDAGSPVPRVSHGPWFKVFVIHNYALFLTGCVLLGSHYVQSPHYRLQLWVTSVIPALLLGMNMSFVAGYWPMPLDPTPLGFALGFALLGWTLLHHQLLDLRPVGRGVAFDSLGQGVLIVDAQQRIVDLNAAAGRLLRRSPATVLGRPLASVLPGLDPGAVPDGRTELDIAAGGCAELRLQVGVAPICAERGGAQGVVLTLHDVTRERAAQQTLLDVQRRLEEANRELERVAHTDMLTGLANRRLLLARLEMEFSRARRHGTPLALLLIDLDRFKQVNDTRGHLVGDAVLRATGAELRALTRPEDIPARYGGEELALLLTDTGADGARTAALRVWRQLRAIEHEDPATGGTFRVSCCIGVALLDPTDSHADHLIARADAALYAAKADGRDCVMLNLDGVMEREPAPVIESAVA